MYCSICHLRLKSKQYDLKKVIEIPVQSYFKKRKAEEDLCRVLDHIKITKKDSSIMWDRLYTLLHKSYISKYRRLYEAIIDIKTQKDNILGKWQSLSRKLTEPCVYYQLNALESVPMKLSEMTPFQRFKYKNPNYRKTTSFIIHTNKFETDYVTIS
jgi:hypothetical protein